MTHFGALKGALERVHSEMAELTHDAMAAADREIAKVQLEAMALSRPV